MKNANITRDAYVSELEGLGLMLMTAPPNEAIGICVAFLLRAERMYPEMLHRSLLAQVQRPGAKLTAIDVLAHAAGI